MSILKPEEQVRQALLMFMVEKLRYPRSLLGVETSLLDLAHHSFKRCDVPNRRVDIVCFDKKKSSPLLLIECKAEILNEKSFRQVVGYNYYIKAPFIAVASQSSILTGVYDKKTQSYEFVEGLVGYQDLEKVI